MKQVSTDLRAAIRNCCRSAPAREAATIVSRHVEDSAGSGLAGPWDGDAWNVDSIKLAGAWAVPRRGRVRRHRVSRIPPEEDRRSRAQGMRYLWALPSLACWPSID